MPIKPTAIHRPWEPQATNEAHGRRVHPNSEFYNSAAWKKIRTAYIRTHPLCECSECKRKIVPLPAHVVDHITPINQGGDPLSWDNLQALSNSCHNTKSARESHGIYQQKK